MVLEHEEITEKIIGAAFEVYKMLINELKAPGIRVGLLINFGKEKVEFKRIVYSHKSALHPRQSAAKTKPKAQPGGDANSVPLRSTE